VDQPVSRQYEAAYAHYYGFGFYWAGGAVWGAGGYPDLLLAARGASDRQTAKDGETRENDDHLRSANEIIGYSIHAIDGDLGAVDDLIVDTETWTIVLVALDTRRWLPGRKVFVPVPWVSDISWVKRRIDVDLTRETISTAPPLEDPIEPNTFNTLYAHFGKRPDRRKRA
jgi:hypothetical protein